MAEERATATGSASDTFVPSPELSHSSTSPKRDMAFWLVFASVCISTFLSALELTSISTALPTIALALDADSDFVWVGNAYTLGATSFLPMSGGLAQIYGRKPTMLGSLVLFALGSALAGAATTMRMLIGGRTVQGIGGGGILALSDIIIADLVPLKERGLFIGMLSAVWAVAAAIGPLIGGVLAEKNWRWLFYLNLPLTGLALGAVILFLNLRTPQESMRKKLARMDWIGNLFVIAGSASCMIALTWGGIVYPWSSVRVLVPLILGFCALFFTLCYEARYATSPIIPYDILHDRTTLSGYLGVVFHSIVSTALIYYFPVYLQVCLGADPLHSAVDVFGLAFSLAPFAIMAGVSTALLHLYRPQNFIGCACTMIAMGLLSTLHADSSKRNWVGFQIVAGLGLGILASSTTFPVLAPLPVQKNAPALAFFAYLRSFSQTWGIAIGASVVQNELQHKLPLAFLAQLPTGVDPSYAAITIIHTVPEPLRNEVRSAFASSLSVLWKVMIGIAGAQMLSVVLLMSEVPMSGATDESWGMDTSEKPQDDPSRGQNCVE